MLVVQVLSQLLSVPGASQTVLDATVPYSAAAMDEYLAEVSVHSVFWVAMLALSRYLSSVYSP